MGSGRGAENSGAEAARPPISVSVMIEVAVVDRIQQEKESKEI